MDNKKKVQDSLNRSLSGLSENPYLAQRVIAQAKGETKVKRKSIGAVTLAIVLALAMMGTAYALFSSRVAELFGIQYGKEMGDWLQGGKVAQVGETVTVGDLSITLDEVVYRSRGLYGVGTIRAADPKDVLLPDAIAEDSEYFFSLNDDENEQAALAHKLAEQAKANGGCLMTVCVQPEQVSVDGGTMLNVNCFGYYDQWNEDGSLTFSFEMEDGQILEDGTAYQMLMDICVFQVDQNGVLMQETQKRGNWRVAFEPVVMVEVETAVSDPAIPDTAAVGDYVLIVPDAYTENGTIPVYRATEAALSKQVDPYWFDQSGIAEKRSEGNFVFADHATLHYSDDYLYYEQLTDEMYDYATLQRTFDPKAEPDLLPIPDLSYFVMTMAEGVHNNYPYGEGVQFEKDQLTYLSLAEAQRIADDMIDKLGLHGYACSCALDMSAERIRTLGEKYNQFWYESGTATNNSPRMDYRNASADDEGYYLIYALNGMHDAEDGQQQIAMYIDRGGIAYMSIRNSFTMGDALYTPDSLISPDEAVATLTAEAAAAHYGKPVLSVYKVSLVYRAVRADDKAEGMVFSPVWYIEYKDAENAANEHDFSWGEINAVNGKLTNASFR